MEDLFYAVLRVCAAAGLGWLSGDGRGRGQDRRECVEGGQPDRGRAAEAGRRDHGRGRSRADEPDAAEAGQDLFGGEGLAPEWADPRSRLARVLVCLADFAAQREAAEARRRAQGQAWLDALAAGEPVTKLPAAGRGGGGADRAWSSK